ncbi:MAG: NAD(P)H-dependent glycerol-3-phosphate dehydrogenase [Deltaproteobacteria bacterium]|nr:NAD(P)H-dependent glycerol-3-phosphate dehydrogenase [Deltaproteobacteria bacterium]
MALQSIGVIGAGAWGTALADRIARNGRVVRLWASEQDVSSEIVQRGTNSKYMPGLKLDKKIRATTDIIQVVDSCRVILIVLPSFMVRKVLSRASSYFRGNQLVVHAVKGLEYPSCNRISEVIKQETCARLLGVLSGPNLAAEVARGMPIATVAASYFDLVVQEMKNILSSKNFLVFSTRDLAGAELAGALSPAAALGCGILESLKTGRNLKAMFIAECLREMRRLGSRLEAENRTFSGLSGVGDLVASCGPESGDDYAIGFTLGRSGKLSKEIKLRLRSSEGAASARAAVKLGAKLGVELPVFESLARVLAGKKKPGGFLKSLMESDRIRSSR